MVKHIDDESNQIKEKQGFISNSPKNQVPELNIRVPELLLSGSDTDSETDEGNLSSRKDSSSNSPPQKIDSNKSEKVQVQPEGLLAKVKNIFSNTAPMAPKDSKTTIIDPDATQKASVLKNLKEDLREQINKKIRAINNEKDKISQGKLSTAALLKLPKFNEINKYKQNLNELVVNLESVQKELSLVKEKSLDEIGDLSVRIGTLNQSAGVLLNQFTELNNIADHAVDKLINALNNKLKASEPLFDLEKYNKLMTPLIFWGEKRNTFCSSIGKYIESNICGNETNKNAVIPALIEVYQYKLANYSASKLINNSKNSLSYSENLKNWNKRDNLLSLEKMERCFEDEKELEAQVNLTLKELTKQLTQLEDKNLSQKLQTLVTEVKNSLVITNSKVREENELALSNIIIEWKEELTLKIYNLKVVAPDLKLTIPEEGDSISNDILACCNLEQQLAENFKQYQTSVRAKLINLQKIEPQTVEKLNHEFENWFQDNKLSLGALTQSSIKQWSDFDQKIEIAAAAWFQRSADAINNIVNEAAKTELNSVFNNASGKLFLLSKDNHAEKRDQALSAVETWRKVINQNFDKMSESHIPLPNELKQKRALIATTHDFLEKISLLNEIEKTQIRMLEEREAYEKLTKQQYDEACKNLIKLENELFELTQENQKSIDELPRILENKATLTWTQKIVDLHEDASRDAWKLYEKNNAKLVEIKAKLVSLNDILAKNENYQRVLNDSSDLLKQEKLLKWQAQYNAFKVKAIKQDGSENPLFATGVDLQVDRYRGLLSLKNLAKEQLNKMSSLAIPVQLQGIEDHGHKLIELIDKKLQKYTDEGNFINLQDMIQVGHQTKRLWVEVKNVAYLSSRKEQLSSQQMGWFDSFIHELWNFLSTLGGFLKKTTVAAQMRNNSNQIDHKFEAFSNQFYANSLVAKLVAKIEGDEPLTKEKEDQLVDELIAELAQSPDAIKDFLLNISGKYSFLLLQEISALKKRYESEANIERKGVCEKLEIAIKEKGTVNDLLIALETMDVTKKEQIDFFAEYASKVLVDRMSVQDMQQQLSIYSDVNENLLSKLKEICNSIGLSGDCNLIDNESCKDILTRVLSSEKEELKSLSEKGADEKIISEKESTIDSLEKRIREISEDTVSTELYRLRKIKDLKSAVENEVKGRNKLDEENSGLPFTFLSADHNKEDMADQLFATAKKLKSDVDDQKILYLLQQRLRQQTTSEFTAETCDLLIQAKAILKKQDGNFLYRSMFENPNAKLIQKIDDYMQKGFAEIAARPSA